RRHATPPRFRTAFSSLANVKGSERKAASRTCNNPENETMATEQKLIERFAGTLSDDAFAEHPDVKAARAEVDAAHKRLAQVQASIRQRLATADRAQQEAERLRLEVVGQQTRIDAAALEDVSDGDFTF